LVNGIGNKNNLDLKISLNFEFINETAFFKFERSRTIYRRLKSAPFLQIAVCALKDFRSFEQSNDYGLRQAQIGTKKPPRQ
jgi:hypothetical protein